MNKNRDYLSNLRHSCAHLLAAAVKDLYPGAHNAIGPSIENGFYQDFDMGKWTISEADLAKIEKRMRELLKTWGPFVEKEVSVEQALKDFAKNPYKVELIREFAKDGKKLKENDPGNFLDLCKGGHSNNPKEELKNFKLLSIAGAYWRGDEKNKMLTRIYGTIFPTKEELDKYLWQREEAKKRDHRKIGKEQDLFVISDEIGGGLPLFTQKGNILRKTIEDYLINKKKSNDYQFVWTPHIARKKIYVTSKHWGKYDAMFNPMKLDNEDYILKPMNCPHHFKIFQSKPRSYKELPLRIAENATVYRYEKSGELNGLLRVRSATIDDTHTFVKPYSKNIGDELRKVIKLIKEIILDFGFESYRVRISTRDKKNSDKYIGDPKIWSVAETSLKDAAREQNLESFIGEGEAAFYGPKIDFLIRDSIGREWQCSTVQLDFAQSLNFQMKFINEKGKEAAPAILHIAMIGSIERFMGILIEHYAGAFPLWLSPIQVAVLTISDKQISFAKEVEKYLLDSGIRVYLDHENKTIGAKIREATLQKIPYMVIIGKNELESYKVNKVYKASIRTREGKDLGLMDINEFIQKLKTQIEKFL